MINMLENTAQIDYSELGPEEDQLIALIYRFASKKEEWFNLLLSLSNCISVSEGLPVDHPYKNISTRVMAHLKNALKISSQLNTSSRDLKATSVLEHIPMAAAIVNETGRLVDINSEAEDYFERSPDWNIDQGYLSAQHFRLSVELLPLGGENHHSVLSLPLDAQTHDRTGIFKSGKTDKPRLVHVTSLPENDQVVQSSKHYYLCFQTEKEDLVSAELLKAHYQLTDTEALVVVTLMQDLSSRKTAQTLKLKDATIRGHLTNIYQKTGVERKPELIRKILLHKMVSPTTNKKDIQPSSDTDLSDSDFQYLYLRDGRKMSYIDHRGAGVDIRKRSTDAIDCHIVEEKVIVLLHNLMGSAKELPPGANELLAENIRVVIPERPGYGNSDPLPERTHQQWVNDLEELLNTLNIGKVYLLAHSIGGAYALALSEYLPERIERIAMVNAMPRIEDITQNNNPPALVTAINRSLKYAPFLIEPILKMAVGKDIEHFYEQQLNYIRPTIEGRAADINLLKTKPYRHYAIANLKHSAKQGVEIWANELRLSFAPLPFTIKNRQTEFLFWHGNHDDVIPIEAAENLAKTVNTADFIRIDDETHFLFARQFNKIVSRLVA